MHYLQNGICVNSKAAQFYFSWVKENLWCSQFVGIQITLCHFPTIEHYCSTFQKPKGVIIFPPTCGKQPAKPGTLCQLSCHQGFVLSGVRDEVRCTTSGKWSAKVQTAICKGRSPPLVRLKTRLLYDDIWVQCRTVPLCNFYQTHGKIVGVPLIYPMRIFASRWIYKIQL